MAGIFKYLIGTKGESGFGAGSTAEDVTKGIDLTGKVAIVTGASSGIGEETSRVLALRGAHVVMPVRNVAAGEEAKTKIKAANPNAKVEVMQMDLSSLSSVRQFSKDFLAKDLPLNLLINNAGVMMCPFTRSADGYELQFATNHLGHFLLTSMLLSKLKETAQKSGAEARIVNVASMAHKRCYKEGVPQVGGVRAVQAVQHSARQGAHQTLAGVMNVTANALCPGGIATKLQRHIGGDAVMGVLRPFLKSIPQGAATTCYAATSPSLASLSGEYLYDSNVQKPSPLAESTELAQKLWEVSDSLVAGAKST
eukprot:jgi/Mesen1/8381/ME000468S07817